MRNFISLNQCMCHLLTLKHKGKHINKQGRQFGHRSGATDVECCLNSRFSNFDKFRLSRQLKSCNEEKNLCDDILNLNLLIKVL